MGHYEDYVVCNVFLDAEGFSEQLIDWFVGFEADDILALFFLETDVFVVLVICVILEGLQEVILEQLGFLDAAKGED